MPATYKRSKLLINQKFQVSFMLYSVAIALFSSAMFYAAVYYFFWKFRTLGASMGLAPDHVFFRFLDTQQSSLNWYWLAMSVISSLGICAWGLLLSHRVAGPLHKLRLHMNRVARSETEAEVQFRSGDYFPELADAYNEQLRTLQAPRKDKRSA